jgi:hypothetical protein
VTVDEGRDVPTMPVPVGVKWGVQEFANAAGETRQFVELYVETPTGTGVYYLPPQNAKELAAGIDAQADAAIAAERGGLIVPNIVVDNPNGQGGPK